MNLNEILDMWEQDANIDENRLDTSSMEITKLHAKYLRLLMNAKGNKTKLEIDYQTLRKTKFRYYRGEIPRSELQELGWEPYQYAKPLKNEMDEILKGDTDLNKIVMRLEYINNVISTIESIMNQLKSRTWDIKNAIQWKQFLAGN